MVIKICWNIFVHKINFLSSSFERNSSNSFVVNKLWEIFHSLYCRSLMKMWKMRTNSACKQLSSEQNDKYIFLATFISKNEIAWEDLYFREKFIQKCSVKKSVGHESKKQRKFIIKMWRFDFAVRSTFTAMW